MPLNAVISGSLYGGIPRNRLTMISGESMTGKTFIICKILANAQKQGLIPVIFDTENAIDKQTAENLGLDINKVKYVPCVSIEQTRNAIYKFLTKAKEDGVSDKFIVAIDSLGNLENELSISRMEKDVTSMDMGTRARAIKTLLRTCSMLSSYTKTTFIISNHLYDNPAQMYESILKEQPGGKAVAYIPSVTVQLARKPEKGDEGKTIDSQVTVGQRNYPGAILRALTVKNRFIQQYLQVEMYLSFKSGLDKYYGLLDLADGFGVIVKDGHSYKLAKTDENIGKYSAWRKDDAVWNKILPELEQKIKENWAYGKAAQEEIPDESEEKL
jgi:RecA/RadA recombinase